MKIITTAAASLALLIAAQAHAQDVDTAATQDQAPAAPTM
jgi:hypothetical protein